MGIFIDRTVHIPRSLPPMTHAGDETPSSLPEGLLAEYMPSAADRMGTAMRTVVGPALVGALVGGIIGRTTAVGDTSPRATWFSVLGGAALGAALGGAESRRSRFRRRSPDDSSDIAAHDSDSNDGLRLRVLEYNVHGGMGGPGKFFSTRSKLDRLADVIAAQQPDIVLLQELDRFAARSNLVDTVSALARRLHPTGAVMTPGIDKVTGRQEGTGVLVFGDLVLVDARGLRIDDAFGESVRRRYAATVSAWARVAAPILHLRWRPYPDAVEYQPRVVTDALVRTRSGLVIRALSGHFSPPHDGVDEPKRQVAAVADLLADWPAPTILGADFNIRDGSVEFEVEHAAFASAGLHEATAGAPPNSDRIYVSAHFRASDPRKLDTPPGEVPASDHSPVVVDLVVTQGQSQHPR